MTDMTKDEALREAQEVVNDLRRARQFEGDDIYAMSERWADIIEALSRPDPALTSADVEGTALWLELQANMDPEPPVPVDSLPRGLRETAAALRTLAAERDALKKRVAELEAALIKIEEFYCREGRDAEWRERAKKFLTVHGVELCDADFVLDNILAAMQPVDEAAVERAASALHDVIQPGEFTCGDLARAALNAAAKKGE